MKVFTGAIRAEAEGLIVKGRQQRFHITLEIKKRIRKHRGVHAARIALSRGSHRDAFMFLSSRAREFEDIACLEKTNVLRPVVEVIGQHVEHAGHE